MYIDKHLHICFLSLILVLFSCFVIVSSYLHKTDTDKDSMSISEIFHLMMMMFYDWITISRDLYKAKSYKDNVKKWFEDIEYLMQITHIIETICLNLIFYALQWNENSKDTLKSRNRFLKEKKGASTIFLRRNSLKIT